MNLKSSILGVAFSLSLVPTASAQEVLSMHCVQDCPTGAPATNDLIFRVPYTLSSNDTTRFADWVAYRIDASTIGPTAGREWRVDPWLADNETLEPDDYDGAFAVLDVDRGHQAPLTALVNTSGWWALNYMSNITPQMRALNRGAWQRLEAAVKDLVRDEGYPEVFVLTGPIHGTSTLQLPQADEPHTIPTSYWKLVISLRQPDPGYAGFIFPQGTASNADMCDATFQADIARIETNTGLTLFPRIPQPLESATLRTALGCP